jgi:hypothetical protein
MLDGGSAQSSSQVSPDARLTAVVVAAHRKLVRAARAVSLLLK